MVDQPEPDLDQILPSPFFTKGDRELLEAALTGKGAIPVSGSDLRKLAKAATNTFGSFREYAATITDEQAAFVRHLRVDEGYSWRAVAEACHQEFGGTWQPPSNQIMGVALCEEAANREGADYTTGEWN